MRQEAAPMSNPTLPEPIALYHITQAALAQSRRMGRVRPRLLSTISFAALPAGQAVLDAYRFLQEIEPKSRPALAAAPRAVITRTWQRYVYQGTEIDRLAYTFCVLDRLKDALRRRELYVFPSLRYADPRQGMIPLADWPTGCSPCSIPIRSTSRKRTPTSRPPTGAKRFRRSCASLSRSTSP
jgi:hypothetical protein